MEQKMQSDLKNGIVPETMQAIGLYDFGSADVLRLLELPVPAVTPGKVLVQVAAASINPADWRMRNGQFRFFMTKKRPYICGSDIAGVVAAVGEGVTKFKPGERVYGMLPLKDGGGYAEYTLISENSLGHVPANLPLAQAAAAPLTALTALQALRDKAKVQPGQQVLINGASGGVGTFAIQIAKVLGAHVTAVCREANAELVGSLGADEVIDYKSQDFAQGEAQYDVIFDAVALSSFGKIYRALRPGGIFVSLNPVAANPITKLMAYLREGRQIASFLVAPKSSDLELLAEWFAKGQVRAVVDRYYSLSEAAQAQGYSETERVRGKLVLIVNSALADSKAAN